MNNKNFFLISFLPAIAYWYLEENYPVRIAVMGGLALALLEITVEYIFTKHVHTLSKFNFFLILFLGGLSLMGDEGIWFKLQPAFSGWAIGGYMGYRLWQGKGLMVEMMESMKGEQKAAVPDFIFQALEKHMVLLFVLYGSFMAVVAISFSTDQWLFWKTIGFYIVFALFGIVEVFFLRSKVKKWHEAERARRVLQQMRPPQ